MSIAAIELRRTQISNAQRILTGIFDDYSIEIALAKRTGITNRQLLTITGYSRHTLPYVIKHGEYLLRSREVSLV